MSQNHICRFKAQLPGVFNLQCRLQEMGFAENLGVVINMKDRLSPADDEYHQWLAKEADNRCFETIIPRASPLQDAARFQQQDRSYPAKYPGDAGKQMRLLVSELLRRMVEGPPVAEIASTQGANEDDIALSADTQEEDGASSETAATG